MLRLLNPLFKAKHHSILGIDISSASVKIIEISHKGDKYCLEGYGCENLPLNALEEHVIKDIDAVSDCIKRLMSRTHFTTKQVALAVPDSAVISKLVQMNDGLSDEEMEELVLIEADKYIPYPINEINLDFEIQGHSAKNSAMLDVLIVASKAENVTSRVEAVERAGLEAQVVDVESFAVERAAQQFINDGQVEHDKTLAIIDLGTIYTNLFVLHGGNLVFSREEKFGGRQLIEAIAEYYQMPFEDAMAAKNEGTLPTDYEMQVLNPFKELVLQQIKRTLQFFYSSTQHGSVDQIVLAGGLSRMPGLVNLIQERMDLKTTIANPLSQMALGQRVDLDAINRDAPALMVACGLALREFE